MKLFFLFIAMTCLIASCNKQHISIHEYSRVNESAQKQNTIQYFSPRFNVNVVLSEKAKLLLDQSHESIIVFGGISGKPKPEVKEANLDETGRIYLYNLESEMRQSGIFKFNDIHLPEKKLKKTESSDYHLLINIASGRKSSQSNFLDCGVYRGSMKAVQDHTIDIQCRLIGEDIHRPIYGTIR